MKYNNNAVIRTNICSDYMLLQTSHSDLYINMFQTFTTQFILLHLVQNN